MYITRYELDEKDDEGCKSCEDNGNGIEYNLKLLFLFLLLHGLVCCRGKIRSMVMVYIEGSR